MLKAKIDEKINRIDYFNEHWYQIDGIDDPLPSVSHVLDIVAKGYGFNEWLKNTGGESTRIAREAADSGSKIHDAIEKLIYGEKINAVGYGEKSEYSKDEWKKITQFYDWYSNLNIKPLFLEKTVYSKEYGVAGTVDFIGYIDDLLCILDWKTGGEYETHNLQIAAYRKMIDEMGFLEKPIEYGGIVYIGTRNRTVKDLNAPGIKTVGVHQESSIEIFESALKVWKWKNPNIKAPTNEFPLEIKLEKNILEVNNEVKN